MRDYGKYGTDRPNSLRGVQAMSDRLRELDMDVGACRGSQPPTGQTQVLTVRVVSPRPEMGYYDARLLSGGHNGNVGVALTHSHLGRDSGACVAYYAADANGGKRFLQAGVAYAAVLRNVAAIKNGDTAGPLVEVLGGMEVIPRPTVVGQALMATRSSQDSGSGLYAAWRFITFGDGG